MTIYIHVLKFLPIFLLLSCNPQKSISDYALPSVKFAKQQYKASNGDFTVLYPKGWSLKEETVDTNYCLYRLECGAPLPDTTFQFFGVTKMKLTKGSVKKELAELMKQAKKMANIQILEEASVRIADKNVPVVHLVYTEPSGKIMQEEIDLFVPFGSKAYYHIGIVCDKNEKTEQTIGMLMECARGFRKLRKGE